MIRWKVAESPTGPYRSFEKRGWPVAWYKKSGKPAAFIRCADEYRPRDIALGDHAKLAIDVCHHNHPKARNSWQLYRLGRRAETLAEAKRLVVEFLDRHPEYAPREDLFS